MTSLPSLGTIIGPDCFVICQEGEWYVLYEEEWPYATHYECVLYVYKLVNGEWQELHREEYTSHSIDDANRRRARIDRARRDIVAFLVEAAL